MFTLLWMIVLLGLSNVALSLNYLQKALDALPALGKAAVNSTSQDHTPGIAIGVISRDKGVLFKAGYGVRAINDSSLLVNPETIFQLASVFKPIASTIISSMISNNPEEDSLGMIIPIYLI